MSLHRIAAPIRLDATPQWCNYFRGGTGLAGVYAAMPLPRRFLPKKPPIGERRCPACGLPMLLASIEPTDQAGHDARTFECADCAFAETEIVQWR